MALLERVARGVVETLGKDDFRRIMNETLDHMLRSMSRRERLQFCEDLVDHSVERMLRGLSNEEKERLFASLIPRLLRHFPGGAAPQQSAGEDGRAPTDAASGTGRV